MCPCWRSSCAPKPMHRNWACKSARWTPSRTRSAPASCCRACRPIWLQAWPADPDIGMPDGSRRCLRRTDQPRASTKRPWAMTKPNKSLWTAAIHFLRPNWWIPFCPWAQSSRPWPSAMPTAPSAKLPRFFATGCAAAAPGGGWRMLRARDSLQTAFWRGQRRRQGVSIAPHYRNASDAVTPPLSKPPCQRTSRAKVKNRDKISKQQTQAPAGPPFNRSNCAAHERIARTKRTSGTHRAASHRHR